MTPTPYGFRPHQQQDDHHLLLACVAVLLSAVVHLVLMYFFSEWAFSGVSPLRERGREWFTGERVPPMRVETMQADPMRMAQKLLGERDTPSRGPIEASERVDSLSQTASPAITVPPPIPREALVPGIPALKDSAIAQIDTTPWMPRQEIAQIFDRTVQDEVAALPRREIPMIERVPKAPDIVPSIDLAGREFGRDPEPPKRLESAEVFDTEISKGTYKESIELTEALSSKALAQATESRFDAGADGRTGRGGATNGVDDIATSEERQARIKKAMEEAAKQVLDVPAQSEEERQARDAQAKVDALRQTVDYQSIDNLLAVGLETYRDPNEPDRIYFRIGIEPRSDKPVATLPKDIVLIQDVSASMSEERMIFCRRAMASALNSTLNPNDRFNVVAFRDTFERCFPDWTPVTDESRQKAEYFASSMRAFGQTDLFGSLRNLLKMPRDPQRPMIAFVVTDGKPTFGVTESAKIISAFTELNNGLVSVNMYGTQSKANVYLLDMLTYCNRGKASILKGDRWDIPETMANAYMGLKDPVMSDITVTFHAVSKSEIYPKDTTNLYKGQQLQLCGVCPDKTEELVFQIRGLAADKGYDSIFQLSLTRHAKLGTAAVKKRWAYQKMYHLVSQYTRTPQEQIYAEMLKLNKENDIPIPYASDLK